MKVYTSMALALVNATAKQLNTKGDKPEAWVARAVVDRVDHTRLGERTIPALVVNKHVVRM